MSEAQVECRESNKTEITRQKSEIDEEREEERDESETPKSECDSTPRCDEPEKNFGGAVPNVARSQPASAATTQQHQQQIQQNRAGECNLLPVLVERLRSALELSCSSQSSEDQLPLEDSGVDSEEDFRLWTTGLNGATTLLNGSHQQQELLGKPKLDLKFLEDILLADIHTALARLQDTLKNVDIGTLTRYNASLDPSNKLYLLRLISNLLAKLKVPEEAISKPSQPETRLHSGSKRRKSERHTISVTAEEIARARRWLNDKNISSNESSPKIVHEKERETERIVEGAPSSNSIESPDITEVTVLEKPGIETPMTFDKGTFKDKCMKDAINQHQSLQIKNNRESQKESGRTYDPLERVVTAPRRFDGLCKDDSAVDDFQDRSASFYQQHSTAPAKQNKFTAKKWKIKRANTIDIPNYLKLKNENSEQHGCFALRRPIDVGDRINGYQRVVPSFEPKTENDRKFLALINKNTDGNTTNTNVPFKSFNFRQNSTVADKNWSNRFSNIKTNFESRENEGESHRKTGVLDVRKKFESIKDNTTEKEGMIVGSLRVPYGPTKQKQNGFTHAPTSPFQKIEKSTTKPETTPPFLKQGHMSKNNSMLQAKLKMFNQDSTKTSTENNAEPPSRAKNKFGKPPENISNVSQPINKRIHENKVPSQIVENGHLNYYSFCKQFAPFASGKTNSSESKSNVNSAKTKLLVNLNKEPTQPEIKRDKPKPAHQEPKINLLKSDKDDNQYDFSKQYSYHKSNDNYPINTYQNSVNHSNVQNYRQLEKKPQFNNVSASFPTAVKEKDVKPEQPLRKLESSTQNVAVQTTYESNNRRPSEPELINSIIDLSQDHLLTQQRKLHNNVSIQTTNPSTVLQIQNANQNLSQTATSPSIISPISHTHESYRHQPPVTNTSNYSTYQRSPEPIDHVPRNYYSSNYVPDQSYHQSDNYSYPSVPYQQPRRNHPMTNHVSSTNHSNEPPHAKISQKLYNEFSKLPDNHASREYLAQDYNKEKTLSHVPVSIPYEQTQLNNKETIPFNPTTYEGKKLPELVEENIENQDISSDGIVTRYTCAIATVSSIPESPEPTQEGQSPIPAQSYEPVVPRIKEPQPRHFAETTSVPKPTDRKSVPDISLDEIQRHNMLQQSLIRRMQNEQQLSEKIPPRRLSQEIPRKDNCSPTSPSFNSANYPGRVCALKALNESHKAQEKINLFEEKRLNNAQVFRPVNVPPKVNVVNPSLFLRNERSPTHNNVSPIDSSDEYLMSCANKPSRNIVLSKSESWHQLALAKGAGGLQVPQPSSCTQLKPPKPKSPSSLRLSKQFEASSASDNVRKMEEKIQRYFQGSSVVEEPKQTSRREAKSKRSLQSKKSMNSLMRSHTMPHLYDERLLDENVDVDKAFDSIFKEATRTDNRH